MSKFKILIQFFREELNIKERNKLKPWSLRRYKKFTNEGLSTHAYIKEESIHLQFHGWELVLLKDGTYTWNSTSGG
jgi:hypothetical protein